MASSFKIPGGREKDVPIDEAQDSSLDFWSGKIRDALVANPNKQYADRDRALLGALEAEMARRTGGAAPGSGPHAAPAPATPRAAANREDSQKAIDLYSGSHDDAKGATQALAQLQEIGHLVSPAPACGTLPDGTAVVISAIQVDAPNETFPLPDGKRGLGKVPLCKIAGALGVSWSPESGRLDDGSDPRFVHYRAVGYIRQFDGTMRQIIGEKVMDLRIGSAQCEAYEKRAKDKAARSGGKVGDWESQIRDMRLFILEHAETKAQLRAIRSLGLRSSYAESELQKPFFAAKLQFTGRSDDPELRRMFAEKIAESMMGATRQLYGAPPAQQRRQVIETRGYSPPPVGNVTADGEVLGEIDRGDDPDDY